MNFNVKRVTEDLEGVFIVGDIYIASITELDFKFQGLDSMEIDIKNDKVDLSGLWATKDFERDFRVVF